MAEVSKLILTQDVTLAIADQFNGKTGKIIVIQNGTGGWKVSLPVGGLGTISVDPYPNRATEIDYVITDAGIFFNSRVLTSDLGIGIENNHTLGSPDWVAPGSSLKRAPLVGGRVNQRMQNKSVNTRTLCFFGTKADLYNAPTSVADTFSGTALYGSNAVRFTSVGATAVTFAPLAAMAVPQNVTGGIIKWNFRPIANMQNLDRFQIELHSAGTPDAPTANYHVLGTDTTLPGEVKKYLTSQTVGGVALSGSGRWQAIGFAVGVFTVAGTGADLTAIKFARITLRSANTTSMTIDLGNIEYVPNKLSKAKCILTFDDAYQSQVTYAAVQMAKYGFRGVLYPSPVTVNTDSNSSYITSDQIKNLHDNLGWQIASQGYTTEAQATIDAMSESQFTAELSKLRNWQNSLGLTGGEHGSYFSGVNFNDMTAFPGFRKHFRSMRGFLSGNGGGAAFLFPQMFPFADPMIVPSLNASSWTDTTNAAKIQAHIDQAIAVKGVAIITYHNELNAAGNVRTGFDSLLAYLDANRANIDVCTEEELHYSA